MEYKKKRKVSFQPFPNLENRSRDSIANKISHPRSNLYPIPKNLSSFRRLQFETPVQFTEFYVDYDVLFLRPHEQNRNTRRKIEYHLYIGRGIYFKKYANLTQPEIPPVR